MSENTKIEWADHTFNPWIGCTKVGPGCDHCYAEAREDKRLHRVQWGAGQPRQRTKTWGDPGRWNKRHAEFFAEHGRRQRVFCASLADVFDNEVDPDWRRDLVRLISETPNLDWLLLTKRIGNVLPMMRSIIDIADPLPSNVWLGATVVNQEEADRDIPKLLATPARVRFLSIEPMLGPIDLSNLPGADRWRIDALRGDWERTDRSCAFDEPDTVWHEHGPALHWIIAGGESGHGARPMHPDWARALRDQCAAAGVPFLFKQNGEWAHAAAISDDERQLPEVWLRRDGTVVPDGERVDFFGGDEVVYRAGKKSAGRLLDGVEHNGFPERLEGAAS